MLLAFQGNDFLKIPIVVEIAPICLLNVFNADSFTNETWKQGDSLIVSVYIVTSEGAQQYFISGQ